MNALMGLRILVTGATGFIGSWLAERLVNEGASVTVLVRPRSARKDSMRSFESKVDVVYGDIRDREVAETIVAEQDLIFHLAAMTQVVFSLRDPVETFAVNFNGTVNLLEAMRRIDSGQVLVYASTDKVYGDPSKLPVDETQPLVGKSPYDASKIAAERAVYAYFRTYGLPVTISRSSNVYGGRDLNFLRAVPDFISSALLGRKIVVRGSGKHVRDFMYIDDAVEAFVTLGSKSASVRGEVFNFGTGKPTRVIELANLVLRLTNGHEYDILGDSTSGEIDTQYLDCAKAESSLSWRPRIDLQQGLRRTLDWYAANRELWIEHRLRV